MSSNRNTMNHNLFRGYQQYVEHHWQTLSFATPPSYQEWNATFFGAIAITNVIIIKQQVSHVTTIKQQQLYFVTTIKQ